MSDFPSFKYLFKALKDWSLIFMFVYLWSFSIWIPKGIKNLNFSPKGPTTFKISEMTLCLSLITKTCKESTILWNVCTFEWMNLDDYQGLFVCKSSSSFSHQLYSQPVKNRNFYIFVASFILQNLKVVGLLWEKFHFFIPLGIQIEIDFHSTNTRLKLHSFMILQWQKSEVWSKNSNNLKICWPELKAVLYYKKLYNFMNILSRCIIQIVSGKVLIRSIQITPGGYNICKSSVVPRETSQVKFVHEGPVHIKDQAETVI